MTFIGLLTLVGLVFASTVVFALLADPVPTQDLRSARTPLEPTRGRRA